MTFEDAFGKYVAEYRMPDRECVNFVDGAAYMHCGELKCFLCYGWHLKWVHGCPYELDFRSGGSIVTTRICVPFIVETMLSGIEFDLDAVFAKLDKNQQKHLLYCISNTDLSTSKTTFRKEKQPNTIDLDKLSNEQVAELAKMLGRA